VRRVWLAASVLVLAGCGSTGAVHVSTQSKTATATPTSTSSATVSTGAAATSAAASKSTLSVSTTVAPTTVPATVIPAVTTPPATTLPLATISAATTQVTLTPRVQLTIRLAGCETSFTSWTVWIAVSPSAEAQWEAVVTNNYQIAPIIVSLAEGIEEEVNSGISYAQAAQVIGPQVLQECTSEIANGVTAWPPSAFMFGMVEPLTFVNGQVQPSNPPLYDVLYLDLLNTETSGLEGATVPATVVPATAGAITTLPGPASTVSVPGTTSPEKGGSNSEGYSLVRTGDAFANAGLFEAYLQRSVRDGSLPGVAKLPDSTVQCPSRIGLQVGSIFACIINSKSVSVGVAPVLIKVIVGDGREFDETVFAGAAGAEQCSNFTAEERAALDTAGARCPTS